MVALTLGAVAEFQFRVVGVRAAADFALVAVAPLRLCLLLLPDGGLELNGLSGPLAALDPQNALDILTEYWFAFEKPTSWLFPSQRNKDKPCCTYNVMRWIQQHETELGWEHRLTCHSFRHAFGTHLYENGTDLLTIKHLMGHKSLASTLIYIHLASYHARNISSPFDLAGESAHE